jgi:hypothetical protein
MATEKEEFNIPKVTVIRGHVSEETAYFVEDYPYGYVLRCSIRYWLETATKGAKNGQMRFVSQTTNPKRGDVWNKPKGSTYFLWGVMYLDQNKHVYCHQAGEFGIGPEYDARMRLDGTYDQLDKVERATYDHLVTLTRRYAEPWERWDVLVDGIAADIESMGEVPVRDDRGMVADHHVTEYEYRTLIAAALAKLG